MRDIIISMASMKKKTKTEECSLGRTVSQSIASLNLGKEQAGESKPVLQAVQSQLRGVHSFQISKGTQIYLSFYCEYHNLLREVVAQKRGRRDRSPFLQQFSQSHSEEQVSKLFSDFISKDRQINRISKLFRQECLEDYFELEEFRAERVIGTMVRRIVQAKMGGVIDFEEPAVKRKKVTRFILEEKENKVKSCQLGQSRSCKKIMNYHQSELYFAILALKMLLKEQHPNTEQVSKLCQDIKVLLRSLLGCIKLKHCGYEHSLKVRPMLRAN